MTNLSEKPHFDRIMRLEKDIAVEYRDSDIEKRLIAALRAVYQTWGFAETEDGGIHDSSIRRIMNVFRELSRVHP